MIELCCSLINLDFALYPFHNNFEQDAPGEVQRIIMVIALIIFILMYIGMLALPKFRVFFALGAALLMIISGILPIGRIPDAINWNVIMMISGTMGIVSLFIESKMPSRLADIILDRTTNTCQAIIALAIFAGIISAFVENVATVLMIAPVGVAICKKMNINPVPVIIQEGTIQETTPEMVVIRVQATTREPAIAAIPVQARLQVLHPVHHLIREHLQAQDLTTIQGQITIHLRIQAAILPPVHNPATEMSARIPVRP